MRAMIAHRFAASAVGALAIGALLLPAEPASAAKSRADKSANPWQLLAEPGASDASARVLARVDLSDQRMLVYVDSVLTHTFKVSTGRGRYRTPTGEWKAGWLARKWRSRKYNGAPMPWSVFYYKGYAVHGTTAISKLGQPASHGCVRLHPDNAKTFYKLVESVGKDASLIRVVQ